MFGSFATGARVVVVVAVWQQIAICLCGALALSTLLWSSAKHPVHSSLSPPFPTASHFFVSGSPPPTFSLPIAVKGAHVWLDCPGHMSVLVDNEKELSLPLHPHFVHVHPVTVIGQRDNPLDSQ